MGRKRPPRDYATGRVTSALRVVSCVAGALVALALLVAYSGMAEVVPVHFTLTGEPDGWGSRTSVLWLAGGGALLVGLVAWLSCKPHIFNYPLQITERNAQGVYREGERMMVWLLVVLAAVFCGIAMQSAEIAGGQALTASVLAMPVVLIVGVVRILGAEVRGSKSRV